MDPIERILKDSRTIAVVGASENPTRPSFNVTKYLLDHGYRVLPVNPNLKELFGQKCYPDILSIPDPIDIVDIFRNPSAVPGIVEQAIAVGARVVWLQPGAENMAAAERAANAGLAVITGVCLMAESRATEAFDSPDDSGPMNVKADRSRGSK